jgi:membrane protease YdiL (CAAX protease family)
MFVIALAIASIAASAWDLSALGTTAIGYSILTLAVVVVLTRFHWWGDMGLGLPAQRRQLWLFVVAFLPALMNALSNLQNPGMAGILLILVTASAVGFVEEIVFRGMMLQALLSRGPWQAALISSLLFGLAHGFNLLSGTNVGATLLQIGEATALGFMFAALALRTHTILLLVAAHGLTKSGFRPPQAAGFQPRR